MPLVLNPKPRIRNPRIKTKNKILFIVGPTAIGKSDVAIKLVSLVNAEIISCDSMQIYKGMDIITSKPLKSIRKKIRHHLIDIISPAKEYNVSVFRQDALKKIKDVLAGGRLPLFVGGTGLYMSILIDGIFVFEPKNNNIRERLYKLANSYGNQYLYRRLKRVDSESASKIHLNDTKRIIRALEVFQNTGKPISNLWKQRKGLGDDYEIKIFCLNMERERLYKRIEERVEKMFAKGLVREVKKLLNSKLSKTACYAIGIKELKGFFDGVYDLEEAKRLIKRNTRLYAKRQLTWLRKDRRISWINIKEREKPEEVAQRIWKRLY